MAIKTIKYTVNSTGITPTVEQLGGTQGDHRVTKLVYTVEDELLTKIKDTYGAGNIIYRLDVYDGEGGIWQSEPKTMEGDIELLLEERHTRFGGKITVYLVITTLSEDNQTEMELYSFPSILRLKNRPNGTYKDGENHESVVGLVEKAKSIAEEAAASANAAMSAESSARQFAFEVQQKLENGEFDGEDGVSVTHSFDGTVLTMSSASGTTKVDLKGEKGEKGDKGDAAKIGVDKTVNGGIVSVAEDGILTNVKFSTDAPQNTTVRIFNEKAVDEKVFYGCEVETESGSITVGYWGEIRVFNRTDAGNDTLGSVGYNTAVAEFTYHQDPGYPEEYGVQFHETVLLLSTYNSDVEFNITDKLIPGDTYILFAVVDSEATGHDMDGNVTNMKHTVKEVYLLNKTQSTVEAVRADGSISTASIKPCTVAMIDESQWEDNYSLNLSYTVTDLATKKYVDEAVKNIDTSGIDISGAVEVDLTDYVKKTSIFSGVTDGVILTNSGFGISHNNGGYLMIAPANITDIVNRATRKPIDAQGLDYAVKVGLTTNTETLTDEEKLAAQSWLGVTDLVGNIETALDELHNYAQAIIGGVE